MSQQIEDTLREISKKIQGDVNFDDWKKERIEKVLNECVEETNRINLQFNGKGLDEFVKIQNEFLLGILISFVYYKFFLYSAFDRDPIHELDLALLQKSLLLNSSKFLELISMILGK